MTFAISSPQIHKGLVVASAVKDVRTSVAPIEHLVVDVSCRGAGHPWHVESLPSPEPNDKKK